MDMETYQYVSVAGQGGAQEEAGGELDSSIGDMETAGTPADLYVAMDPNTYTAADQRPTMDTSTTYAGPNQCGQTTTCTDSDTGLDDKIVLNIGGTRFVTYRSTLQSLPDTRLALLTSQHKGTDHQDKNQNLDMSISITHHQEYPDYDRQQPEYDKATNEYFYDRNPVLFSHILDAYRQGELHVPHCVCAPVLRRELEYWGLAETMLAPLCCVETCREYEESCRTLQEVDDAFSGQVPPPGCRMDPGVGAGWLKRLDAWRIRTWMFLEDPNSSREAKIWAYLFVLLLLSSVMVVCLDSLPSFRIPSDRAHSMSCLDPSYNMSNPVVYNNPKLMMYLSTVQHPAMFYINHCTSVFFGAELLLRFLVCPYKKSFLKSFFNIIDVLAVVPTTAASVVSLVDLRLWLRHNLTVNYILFTFTSIFRAIRIVKLMKHYRGLRVMFLALKASSPEMLLLTLLLSIAIIIFSTTIYFTELHHPDTFPSIPVGFWWSVVTMTTVGYGDSIPQTAGGYVVGALCAVSGMLITGLPIPIMANNFRLYYTSAKLHAKLEAREAKLQASHTQIQTNSPKLHAKLQAREAKLQSERSGSKTNSPKLQAVKAKLHRNSPKVHPKSRDTQVQGHVIIENGQQNTSHLVELSILQDRPITSHEHVNGLHVFQNGIQEHHNGQHRSSLHVEQNGAQNQADVVSKGLPDSDIELESVNEGMPPNKVLLDL